MANIVLVGSGRVAQHLGNRLIAKGLPVAQVLSRNRDHARALGESLHVAWSDRWSDALPDADWVLVAVRDDAIGAVAAQLAQYVSGALVTHTSGATPGSVLAPFFRRYGVFYPLQSFSAERTPDWSGIPFCVDASMERDIEFLETCAAKIGHRVYRTSDAQRAQLHVAAVFANNFANHCFAIAEKILREKGLPFELLHPLMEETLAKALQNSPEEMQTGPAIRGDVETIKRHLDLLNLHPEWQELYRKMSDSIRKGV